MANNDDVLNIQLDHTYRTRRNIVVAQTDAEILKTEPCNKYCAYNSGQTYLT